MKNKNESFNEFYDNYNDIIEKYRKKELNDYKKTIKKIWIESILLGILSLAFLYFTYTNIIFIYYRVATMVLSVVFLVVLCVLTTRLLNKEKSDSCYVINAVIYRLMLEFLSNHDYCFDLETQISEEDFNRMNLFNMKYLNFTGSNLTAATYKDKRLVMCDVWLYDLVERIKTDSYYSKKDNTTYITNYHYHDRVDIFNGLYYETTINRDNNEYIYMIPNNISDKFIQKNIYHYITYEGKKIELENLEFSERYSVFSFNEIKSRYILSLTLMEKINRLDKMISNKKYIVFKPDGRVGIFIDGFQIDKLFSKTINFNNRIPKEYVNKYFTKVNNLFNITQILEEFNPFE